MNGMGWIDVYECTYEWIVYRLMIGCMVRRMLIRGKMKKLHR